VPQTAHNKGSGFSPCLAEISKPAHPRGFSAACSAPEVFPIGLTSVSPFLRSLLSRADKALDYNGPGFGACGMPTSETDPNPTFSAASPARGCVSPRSPPRTPPRSALSSARHTSARALCPALPEAASIGSGPPARPSSSLPPAHPSTAQRICHRSPVQYQSSPTTLQHPNSSVLGTHPSGLSRLIPDQLKDGITFTKRRCARPISMPQMKYPFWELWLDTPPSPTYHCPALTIYPDS
jgi:hypothetical protein